jgi:hypothetical protein
VVYIGTRMKIGENQFLRAGKRMGSCNKIYNRIHFSITIHLVLDFIRENDCILAF